jgi:hypothetical protein
MARHGLTSVPPAPDGLANATHATLRMQRCALRPGDGRTRRPIRVFPSIALTPDDSYHKTDQCAFSHIRT